MAERWVSAYESRWAGARLEMKPTAEHSRSAPREAQAMDRFPIERKVYIEAESWLLTGTCHISKLRVITEEKVR